MLREEFLRFKCIADGCETWEEVIKALENGIQFVTELKELGCKITSNQCDWLFYSIPKGKSKEYNKMFEVSNDKK